MNTPLSCLADFYPVRPRRRIIYPAELLNSEKAPQNSSLTCELDNPPPAVYLITRNLLMEPKIVINARIIVVGASSTGIAFLEQLAFSWAFFPPNSTPLLDLLVINIKIYISDATYDSII